MHPKDMPTVQNILKNKENYVFFVPEAGDFWQLYDVKLGMAVILEFDAKTYYEVYEYLKTQNIRTTKEKPKQIDFRSLDWRKVDSI